MRTTLKDFWMVGALALGVLAGPASLAATEENATQIDLPAQPLAQAIQEVARQASVNILVDPRLVAGRQAPQLSARLSVDQALTVLLKGTGLMARFVDDKTITLVEAGDRPTAGELSAASDMRLAEAGSGTAGEPAASQQEPKLEEVVVTAQKREERAKNVPISMTVLSGESLDHAPIPSVMDALRSVPGVVPLVAGTGARVGGNSVILMRGVPTTAGSSTVGYYLDSSPFSLISPLVIGAFAPDANAYDLERVEVLRGPQGTLYGVSAVTGVVRVLTKDPDLHEFGSKMRGSVAQTAHGSESYRGDLALNLPIIEGKLAARAVVGYQKVGGWIDRSLVPEQANTIPPRDPALPDPGLAPRTLVQDVNDDVIKTFRLKVSAAPTDALTLKAFVWDSRSNLGSGDVSADGRTHPSRYREPFENDYDVYGGSISYAFSAFTLNSSTSYLDFRSDSITDYQALVPSWDDELLATQVGARVFSEELALNSSTNGPWRWTVGALYRDESQSFYQTRQRYTSPTGTRWRNYSESTAVYGELTRKLFDGHFEITAGARYYADKQKQIEDSYLTGVPPGGYTTSNDTFSNTTPRLVLNWLPNDRLTVYASYGEGFRSGQLQQPITLHNAPQYPGTSSDKLRTYEVGAKGRAWGGRAQLDAALFYLDWKDVQQLIGVVIPNGSFPIPVTAYVNAPSASGSGFEVAGSLEPVQGLILSANFSWSGLKTDAATLTGSPPVVLIPQGARLTYSPEYTAGLSAEYAFPMGAGGLTGRFKLAGNYLPKLITGTLSDGSIAKSDAYVMARSSFAIESQRNWTAALFVENLTDDNSIAARDTITPATVQGRWNTRLRPRTIGLQFEFKY